ncbi:MAG: hypothetical protein EBR82_52430 [Caulobacteraceae bacterium]|nr:hypothetical protein [Caulobacteraceae bacterium]
MDYAGLTENIQTICETTFTAQELAMFTEQAEQKIYATVDLPAQRFNVLGNATQNNTYLSMAANMLYVYSLAVINNGTYTYLLNKDVNFIREAYPTQSATGLPQHYAFFDQNTFILGPTPDANYQMELNYSTYPESIVTAGTTWLGNEFDSALLNGALVEAIRFMKGEADLVAQYEKLYLQSVALLKNLSDGKLRQDMYRDGQSKIKVT